MTDQSGVVTISKISSLPVEVLYLILTHLTPTDLLAFRKTCRHHNASTQNTLLWRALLRDLCRVNHVFEPTFAPMECMELRDLERAVLTPARWLRTLRSGTTRDANAGPSELMKAGDPDVLGAGTERVFFVPGGRFAVCCGAHESNAYFLMLLDFGVPAGEGMGKARLVEMRYLGPGWIDNREGIVVCRTKDGEGLRIGMTWSRTDEDVSVVLYEIFPGRDKPVFQEIASICLTDLLRFTPDHLLLDATRIVICAGCKVVVRDFVEDTWVAWSFSDGSQDVDAEDESEMILNGPLLLQVSPEYTKIWVIPPSITRRPLCFPVLSPIFEKHHTERSEVLFSLTPESWYQSRSDTDVPLTYVQMCVSNPEDPNPSATLHLDRIMVDGDPTEASSYSFTTQVILKVPTSSVPVSILQGFRFHEQRMVAIWELDHGHVLTELGIIAHGPDDPAVEDMNSEGGFEGAGNATQRTHEAVATSWEVEGWREVVGFCPVFGRVLTMDKDRKYIVPYELVL